MGDAYVVAKDRLDGWLLVSTIGGQADVAPEIVQRGKDATALVEVEGGQGFGTAFCIDAAGYFVTNEHVVMLGGEGRRLSDEAGQGAADDDGQADR